MQSIIQNPNSFINASGANIFMNRFLLSNVTISPLEDPNDNEIIKTRTAFYLFIEFKNSHTLTKLTESQAEKITEIFDSLFSQLKFSNRLEFLVFIDKSIDVEYLFTDIKCFEHLWTRFRLTNSKYGKMFPVDSNSVSLYLQEEKKKTYPLDGCKDMCDLVLSYFERAMEFTYSHVRINNFLNFVKMGNLAICFGCGDKPFIKCEGEKHSILIESNF